MDVTASVIAIWQLTSEVIQYLHDVNNAPKEYQQLAIEASNLLGPLTSLRYCAEQADSGHPWFEQLRKLNVKDGPLEQYKQALELLRITVDIGDVVQTIKRRLLWKFTKEQVAGILARIERLKSLISVALQMDDRKLSEAIKNDTAFILVSLPPLQASAITVEAGISTLHNKTHSVKDDTASIRSAFPPLQASINAIRDAESLQYHQEVVKWLSTTDFSAQQYDIIVQRQEGTAQWFLDSKEFNEWLQGPDKTLFCSGIPGAGKTMIAAVAIDYLCQATNNMDVGIAYLFCSYKAQVDQTAANLLAALLKQLVQSRPDIVAPVTGLRDQHSKRNTKPSLSELTQALMSICSSYSIVYLVVDALDECSNTDGERRKLLDKLRDIQIDRNIRLLFTSRNNVEIEEDFQFCPQLEVRASNEDMRCFVTDQLPLLSIPIDKELEQDIEREIVGATDGMFLLARLHIATLLKQTTPNEVRGILSNLRKGSEALEQAYNNALHRIDGQPERYRILAKHALYWITLAQRPLTKNELCHALAIRPDQRALDHGDLTAAKLIVSVCAGLVTVDDESGIIRLVHYTTQEYFERVRVKWNPTAHEDIAVACLTYLSFDAFKSGSYPSDESIKRRHAEHPFLGYSARHWGEHVRPVQDCTLVSKLALAFLRSDVLVDSAIQSASIEYGGYSKRFCYRTKGLHLTARYGLSHLTQRLLGWESGDAKIEIDSIDSHGRGPLYYAAEGGYEMIVKLLLDRGANVNDQGVLYVASEHGHETVVKLLLDKGADANQSGWWGSALEAASGGGHGMVVKLLLDKGADINAESTWHGSALLAASCAGHETVIKLLVAAGATLV